MRHGFAIWAFPVWAAGLASVVRGMKFVLVGPRAHKNNLMLQKILKPLILPPNRMARIPYLSEVTTNIK